MFCEVTQHFLSFCSQIDAIHRNSIAFVFLRCYDRFVIKSMQVIVVYSLALFWMFCDVTQHYWSFWRQIDAIHYNLITFVVLRCFDRFVIKSMQVIVFWSLLEFCVVLIVLSSNRSNSWYFGHFSSFALFWMFCVVTQHFRSFWRHIDAIHYNLITFVVLRCFECFPT